jgi:uncharacterized membrane protein YczE
MFADVIIYVVSISMLSFSISLMVKSDFGVSAVSCVPYILSLRLKLLTQGQWFFVLQFVLMVLLSFWLRRAKGIYAATIITSVFSGILIDVFNRLIQGFRGEMVFRMIYLVCALTLVSAGIALSFRTRLPIMAVDLFVIELSSAKNWALRRVKTAFDISLVSVGLALTFLFFGRLKGIGFGTVCSASFVGGMVGYVDKKINSFLPR